MKKKLTKAVFLDFDGVLFSTVREAYAVSMIALGRSDQALGINFKSAHYKWFNQYRYLIGPAWNYYYLIQSIDKKIAQLETDLELDFKKSLKILSQKEHFSFEGDFFCTRNYLRELDSDKWLKLIVPCSFVNELRGLFIQFPNSFFLVTTRDHESVDHILRSHQIRIPDDNIFSRDQYSKSDSKAAIITKVISEYQIAKSIFVDDHEEHLAACTKIDRLKLMHARWGYVFPEVAEDNSKKVFEEIKNFILD